MWSMHAILKTPKEMGEIFIVWNILDILGIEISLTGERLAFPANLRGASIPKVSHLHERLVRSPCHCHLPYPLLSPFEARFFCMKHPRLRTRQLEITIPGLYCFSHKLRVPAQVPLTVVSLPLGQMHRVLCFLNSTQLLICWPCSIWIVIKPTVQN